MLKSNDKRFAIAKWGGVAALGLLILRGLILPFAQAFEHALSWASYSDIDEAFEEFLDIFTIQFSESSNLIRLLGDAVIYWIGLLPLVLVVVYLLFLYRKNRHHVLLPIAFLVAALWQTPGVLVHLLNLIKTVSEAFELLFHGSLEWIPSFFDTLSFQLAPLMANVLWAGICLLLAVDGFTKFRLRWVSVGALIFYMVGTMGNALFSWTQSWPLYPSVMTFHQVPLTFMLDMSYALITILPAVAYLLFWIFGAKRLPEAETVETAEEITKEAAEVAAE